MTTEHEPLPESEVLPSSFEWSASYVAGLIGLSVGVGFYGLLFLLLLVALAIKAPNAPSAAEGRGIFCAAFTHLLPLCLWLIYRGEISRLPNSWKWALAVGAWGLILATLAAMAICFGM